MYCTSALYGLLEDFLVSEQGCVATMAVNIRVVWNVHKHDKVWARCPLESAVLNHKTREIKMSKYGGDLRLSRAISPNLALFANHYVAPKIPVLETNVTNGALACSVCGQISDMQVRFKS